MNGTFDGANVGNELLLNTSLGCNVGQPDSNQMQTNRFQFHRCLNGATADPIEVGSNKCRVRAEADSSSPPFLRRRNKRLHLGCRLSQILHLCYHPPLSESSHHLCWWMTIWQQPRHSHHLRLTSLLPSH